MVDLLGIRVEEGAMLEDDQGTPEGGTGSSVMVQDALSSYSEYIRFAVIAKRRPVASE